MNPRPSPGLYAVLIVVLSLGIAAVATLSVVASDIQTTGAVR
jgi:hypothetical protein